MPRSPEADKVGADEAGPAGDQHPPHGRGHDASARRREARQWGAVKPSLAQVSAQSSTLNGGRRAADGHSCVEIGATTGGRPTRPAAAASSPIATAKSYQEATPASAQCQT